MPSRQDWEDSRIMDAEYRRAYPPTVSDREANGRAADAQVSAYERYVDALSAVDRRRP